MPLKTVRRFLVALMATLLILTVVSQAPAMALPGAPAGLTPDGDDVTDNPLLHWNAVSGATSYKVQVSVSPTFAPTIYNITTVNTNFVPYNAIPTGTVYWRVAAIDGTGQGPYTEAQFTRTLDGPGLVAPADDPGGTTPLAFPGTPIRFQWESLSYANSYELQVDDAADFVGATIVKTDATQYTLPDTKVPGQNFFWRVRAATDTGGAGVLSQWSDTWEFRTSWDATAALVSPPDNTVTAITDIELSWTPVVGADHYELVIAKDIFFNEIISTVTSYGTTYSPPETLPNASYHWRVRPVDVDGHAGTWSQTAPGNPFSFTRAWTPAPTIVSPTTSMGNPPRYQWTPTAAIGGAAQSETWYEVQVDTNPGFPAPQICLSIHTTVTRYADKGGANGTPDDCDDDLFDLASATTYYWRVRGIDETSGVVGIWSAIEDFTYVGAPAPTAGSIVTPDLISPPDCDAACGDVLTSSPMFEWEAVPGAEYYLIIIANDANFTNIHSRWQVDGFTSFMPNSEFADNDAGEAYYWHVRACDSGPTPDVCSPDPEGTLNPPSFAFQKLSVGTVLTAPADDPAGLPESPIANLPRFSWQDYQDTNPSDVSARQYRIEVATDPAFGAIIDNRLVDQTFYTPYALTYPEGPLWWRVRAVDGSSNELTWSPVRRLLKTSPPPALVAPANGATVGITPTFDWADQPFAAEYVLEVYKNDPGLTFPAANRVINQTTAYSEWTNPDPLPAGDDYSWRIRREDGQGKDGPWTAGRLFDVAIDPSITGMSPCGGAVLTDNAVFSWNPLDEAVTYRFERSLASSFTSITESRVTVDTKWAPTVVIPNGPWYWRVVPLDAGDDTIGDPADWTVCLANKGSLPSAPTSYGVDNNKGQAIITWGPPSVAGTPAFHSYRVTLNPGNITQTIPKTRRTATFNGLINGTLFTVSVVAVSDIGESTPLVGSAAPNGCAGTPFGDVPAGDQFCPDIAWLYDQGITTGSIQPDFQIMYQPAAPVTRQAMAAFLYRFHDEPDVTLTEPFFADFTDEGHLFYDAVQWMAESGLSTGTPNPPGKPLFKPADGVSRQAMSAFLHRDAGDDPPVSTTPYFADVGPSNVFFEDIQWMNEAGISTGTMNPPGLPLYKPALPVSRQAMAAFLHRYDEEINNP